MDTTAQKCRGGSSSMICSPAVWKDFLKRYFGDSSPTSYVHFTLLSYWIFRSKLPHFQRFVSSLLIFTLSLHLSPGQNGSWLKLYNSFFCAQLNCLLFLSILVEGFLWLYSLLPFLSTSGHLRKSSLPRKLSCAINDLQFEVDLSFNTIGLLIWTVIFGQFHFGEFQGFLDC